MMATFPCFRRSKSSGLIVKFISETNGYPWRNGEFQPLEGGWMRATGSWWYDCEDPSKPNRINKMLKRIKDVQ